MAKIYETREDMEREHLTNEVKEAQSDRKWGFGLGIAQLGWGVGLLNTPKFKIVHSDLPNDIAKNIAVECKPGILDKLSKIAGGVFVVTGIVHLFLAISNGNKAKKAEAELSKLGSQKIILPEDIKSGDDILATSEHVARLEKKCASQGQAKTL